MDEAAPERPETTVTPERTPPRRLYREPEEKKLAGVCGGLADYFGLDPTVVRLAVVLLALGTGVGFIAYLIAAVIIPRRPDDVPRVRAPVMELPGGLGRTNALLVALIILGILVVLDRDWWFSGATIGFSLLVVGLWLLLSRDSFHTESVQRATLSGEVASEREYTSADSAGPQDEVPPPVPPWGPTNSPPNWGAVPPKVPSVFLSPLVGALLMIGLGVMALLAVFEVFELTMATSLSAGLVLLGAVLIVTAWRGRAGALIPLGLLTMAMVVVADAIKVPLDAGMGDREINVVRRSELDDTYELLAGELVLDLDEAPFSGDGSGNAIPTLHADVGMGNLEVQLPKGVTAYVDVDVNMGSVLVDGERGEGFTEEGIDIERSTTLKGVEGGGRIRLDLHVGMGELAVTHG